MPTMMNRALFVHTPWIFLLMLGSSCGDANEHQSKSRAKEAPCSMVKSAYIYPNAFDTKKKNEYQLDTIHLQSLLQKLSKTELSSLLECRYESDQFYRAAWHKNRKSTEKETSQLSVIDESLARVDRINQQILSAIVALYGWPTTNTYSRKAVKGAYFITMHSGLDYKVRYLPLLEKAIQSDTTMAVYFAIITDKSLFLDQGKRQLYGTHGFIHSSTGKFSIFPVDNVSVTNQKRKELGLPEVSDKTGEITMPEPRQMPIAN